MTGPDDPGAPRETGQSILITFRHEGGACGRSWREYERGVVLPLFRRLQAEHQDAFDVRYLRESSLHGLRTVAGNLTRSWPVEALRFAVGGKRPPRPYRSPILNPSIDLLVRMDLKGSLTERQLDALKMLRAELESAGKVHVAKSTNFRVYEHGTASESDTPTGFLTRWRSDRTLEQQDTYWKEGHGRYAVSLGFPSSLRSYDQLHHGTHDPDGEVFDAPRAGGPSGWSWEMIAGRHPILMWMLDPSALRVNWRLIADERKFTLSPEWLVFQRVELTEPADARISHAEAGTA